MMKLIKFGHLTHREALELQKILGMHKTDNRAVEKLHQRVSASIVHFENRKYGEVSRG